MEKTKGIQLFILVIFGALAVYLLKFIIVDRQEVMNNVYNPRKFQITGTIVDKNDNIVAETRIEKDKKAQEYVGYRYYPKRELYAHIVGDVSKSGQVIGVETKYRQDFINKNPLSQIKEILIGKPTQGNRLILTLDEKLQKIASDELEGKKGAVIAIEPNTGKILAMVSKPDFDPNILTPQGKEDYSLKEIKKIKDQIDEGKAFLNRATQGYYPPASTFKLITGLTAIRYMKDWRNFTYISNGTETFHTKERNVIVNEFGKKSHGTVDMYKAMTVSSNIYFAALGRELGSDKIKKVADSFGFNSNLQYDRFSTKSGSVFEGKKTEEGTLLGSFGQGPVAVTPMHMAQFIATIANSGYMMKPYLVDRIETPSGAILEKNLPEVVGDKMSIEESKILTDMMIDVVKKGTGRSASLRNIVVAGKTGTAEHSGEGEDHGWFVGFAPADNPKIAVAIIVENGGTGGASAAPIAKKLFSAALQ